MTALWIDQNGRVACPDHAGHYLRSALDAVPDGIHIFTPLGHWSKAPETADLHCENC